MKGTKSLFIDTRTSTQLNHRTCMIDLPPVFVPPFKLENGDVVDKLYFLIHKRGRRRIGAFLTLQQIRKATQSATTSVT